MQERIIISSDYLKFHKKRSSIQFPLHIRINVHTHTHNSGTYRMYVI